jgi:hypothetical protein
MSRRRVHLTVAAALATAVVAASVALVAAASGSHDNGSVRLHAHLIGFQEVPSLNSTGHASLRATMTPDQITFELTYADLSAPPLVAHIHVGQRAVNGAVSVFFCGGSKPPCPSTVSGTVSGTITAADVTGPTAQGFKTGDLASLETAIRAGVTYANMHTSNFPNGEIRGQIRAGHGRDDH